MEFRLEEVEKGGTRVTVTESGFDRLSLARRAKAFADNEKGWEIQMAALQEYAGSPRLAPDGALQLPSSPPWAIRPGWNWWRGSRRANLFPLRNCQKAPG